MSQEWENASPAPTTDAKRGRRPPAADAALVDALPPHSLEAEQGVLGCALLAPLECIPAARKQLADAEGREFYDLRHREIWLTLCRMYDDRLEGKPLASNAAPDAGIDLITVQQRLKDYQKLEDAGGLAYLATLPDKVPGPANLGYYLAIVAEKFIVRQTIGFCAAAGRRLHEWPGQAGHLLEELQRDFDRILALTRKDGEAPQRLKPAGTWGEEVWNEFMGIHSGEQPGLPLPIEFKFRLRMQECTLMTGDDGSGKTTFLNYAALHLANAGLKTLIASFEMPPKKTLRQLLCQLAGTRDFPDTPAGQALFRQALSWINRRFYLYDFLGIGDWRDVLNLFQHGAEQLGIKLFILDSVMRIGIADDDYGTQGLAAARFAQWAQNAGVHLFLVIHENKGGEGKAKVRGSKLWTANADNIIKIERNMEKGIKLDELWADLEEERAREKPNQDEIAKINAKREEWKQKWDARAVLIKQREMGSQQNASKYFYFDGRNFQYREHHQDPPVNWLHVWSQPGLASGRADDVTDNWPKEQEASREASAGGEG